jgi:ABC-2 type transport system permease protein
MKKAWVLSKLYINSLYGFSGFIYDLKLNKKAAIKKIAFIILIALAFSSTVGMFVFFNAKMYDILKPINQQRIVITLSIIIASILTLVFGIIGAIATYFVEKEGDLILSMPLKPWHILTAKFSSNYVYEAIISFFIMATGFIVYGIKSGAGPYFYLTCLITTAFIPLIPLVVGYLIVIPLMRAGSVFRKKDFTMIMTGVIAIIFAFGIQYLMQTMVKVSADPSVMLEKLTSPNGLVSIAGKIYYPSLWATYGIVDGLSASGIVNLLVYIVISFMVFALLITSMSNIYAESIVGSQEVTKSKKYTQGQLKEKLKSKSIFSTLINREIRLMNREPVYLINGPLIILFIPAIFAFVFFLQKGELSKAFGSIGNIENAAYYITLAIAGVSVFLGTAVNITSTCISREGKAFDLLKSMPVEPKKIIAAKLIHGLIFGALASLMCIMIGFFAFKISFVNLLLAFIKAILVMLPILIAGILIELSWPKLLWDNPQKAMKQNLNGVIIILGSMCVVPLMGYLVFTFLKTPALGYTVLIIIPLIISVTLYKLLMKYGDSRYYDIEV